jgi:hypothetical protein
MVDRWDCQRVVCIKEYKTIKVGSHYDIKGRGNLTYNADPEVGGRKGYGFCIEDQYYGSFSDDAPTVVEKIGGIYHMLRKLSGITLLKKKCQNTLSQKKKIINLIVEMRN